MENLIGNKELSEAIIYVLFGRDYAQIISKESKELPSTIVRRLQKLEKHRILKSKKEKLLNRTRYEINWTELSKLFCMYHPAGKNSVFKGITMELFQDKRFIEMFKQFAIEDVLLIGTKKVNLEKIFDDFVKNIPKVLNKIYLKNIEDNRFRVNLKEFIEECEYYNRQSSPVFQMDEVLRRIVKNKF